MKKIVLVIMLIILFTSCQPQNSVSENSNFNNSTSRDASSVPAIPVSSSEKSFTRKTFVKENANYGVTYLWLNHKDIMFCAMNYENGKYKSAFSVLNTATQKVNFIEKQLQNYCALFSTEKTQDEYLITDFSGNEMYLSQDYQLSADDLALKKENLSAFYDANDKATYQFDYSTNSLTKTVETFTQVLHELPITNDEHISCIRISPDKKALSMAVMENFYSSKTIVCDLEKNTIKTIPITLGLPAYFWINNRLVALSFDDNRGGTYAYLLNDNLPLTDIKLCDNKSSVDFSSGTYQYGADENNFPFVIRTDGQNELMLLSIEDNNFILQEILQTPYEISQPQLSTDGKHISFFTSNGIDNPPEFIVRKLQAN